LTKFFISQPVVYVQLVITGTGTFWGTYQGLQQLDTQLQTNAPVSNGFG